MRSEKGFTVIEAIVAVVVLLIIGVFFLVQKNELETATRDQSRKIAINSIYYGLTEVYNKENGYYPTSVDENNLRSVSPELFTDPNGIKLGEAGSDYFYEGINCDIDGRCKEFRLSSVLEKEEKYEKTK